MTQSPPALKRIRLELARAKDFPNGSATHGYEFVAPLDDDSRIDPAAWQKNRERCHVQRFWGDDEELGRLLHRPGGGEHVRWMFDYQGKAAYDDEAGYRFGAHSFRQGEYVSITDEAGDVHTFRVVSVMPLA